MDGVRRIVAVLLACTACATFSAAGTPDDGAQVDGGSDAGSNPGSDSASDEAARERVVFLTQTQVNPNFGGFDGATERCNTAAKNGNGFVRGKAFVAWVSDATHVPQNSFVHGTKRYYLPDDAGTTVANDWTELTSGTLRAPINVFEDGSRAAATPDAWTGTTANGTATTIDCSHWTVVDAGAVKGTRGAATSITQAWSNEDADNCDTNHHLYCFEK